MSNSPAFGQADLTNCEREQIHLAGSIQPHGLLLVLQEPQLRVVQASRTAEVFLQRPLSHILESQLSDFGSDVERAARALLAQSDLAEPQPLVCRIDSRSFEGALHRVSPDALVLELQPVVAQHLSQGGEHTGSEQLMERLSDAVQRFSEASSIGVLADAVVQRVRDLIGYDRVMVYRFDPDGHGQIVAEARHPRLESLLGHRYPATDIPQRARELYIRNRVRVLVDVNYEPSELVPRALHLEGAQGPVELDMSMCHLRSMSPLHIQYLKNMGVTATAVVSLVREGQLWGLIACHHDTPRNLPWALRAGCELLGAAISTRIAAIENYARAQVAIQVRRLEQRLVEATSTEGDWRLALFRHPQTLLHPLSATGAVLFDEGEVLTCGEVPSTPELRALHAWISQQPDDGPVHTSALSRSNPELASLTPTASGVLAVRLSSTRPDFLVWLRKEQLQSYTWAGDPSKPIIDNDPLKLSPRRSFAVWSEIVRGTGSPWTPGELALAAAFGDALIDIIVQVHAVRLLIAEDQLQKVRAGVADSKEAVVVSSASGGAFYANAAFHALAGRADKPFTSLDDFMSVFDPPSAGHQMLGHVRAEQRSWRGEMALARAGQPAMPVGLRAEPVPARNGSTLGYIFIFTDLTAVKQADDARQHLEASLSRAGRMPPMAEGSELIGALIANAGLAAMDIADGGPSTSVAPLMHEVEEATERATRLLSHIRLLLRNTP